MGNLSITETRQLTLCNCFNKKDFSFSDLNPSEDLVEDMWLGVSVASQGYPGGRVLVSFSLYCHLVKKVKKGCVWSKGMSASFSEQLDG